ncbi:NIF system FeS cluster assembly, NifU [Purpureocillium lavendulum]|uniref:NIF system FeS cluster assembly, NifU n=1 Tax=Purpureocillium lavendulum TaxID=1247861 RepID=A0AB34FMU5_9HYPO|nr:NIF system FeS cluster assembly, NifU [Purpureocillium lavendulum]
MPDLNSVPASPHSLAASRRQSSHQMPPPTVSQSPSLNILPSNQDVVSHGGHGSHSHTHSRHHSLSHAASSVPSPQLTASQPLQPQVASITEPGVGPGPGPLRHPRPLTAAELHTQLEKEQEAVVNRLTRELSLLRAAQNASVVSNTSSTSATTSTHDPIAEASLLSGSGFSIPTTRRHHRNSSSASQNLTANQLGSSYEARHHATPARPPQPIPLSRQDSAASRRSQTNSPGPQVSSLDPSSYFHQQRIPPPASVPMSSVAATPGSGSVADQMSPGMIAATSRYEETAFYRSELETAKKENETLKRRIRDLERLVQSRRATETSRTRSESVSTTASTSVATAGGAGIAGPRDVVARPERGRGMTSQSVASVSSVAVGVPEDEVKVGESAASSGVGNTQS